MSYTRMSCIPACSATFYHHSTEMQSPSPCGSCLMTADRLSITGSIPSAATSSRYSSVLPAYPSSVILLFLLSAPFVVFTPPNMAHVGRQSVPDCGRPVRLPQFARLSPTDQIRGRYESGRHWHIPVAPRRRPFPTREPAPVWCLYWRRRPPLRREKDAHHLLFFPTLLYLMTPRHVPRWNSLSDYYL